jgi:hypothetical protein
MPNLFEYQNYRAYLHGYYNEQKAAKGNFYFRLQSLPEPITSLTLSVMLRMGFKMLCTMGEFTARWANQYDFRWRELRKCRQASACPKTSLIVISTERRNLWRLQTLVNRSLTSVRDDSLPSFRTDTSYLFFLLPRRSCMDFKRLKVVSQLTMMVVLAGFLLVQGQTFDGYTFFASGKSAYLYDMNKKIVHTWSSNYSVAGNADLLRDSSVIFPSSNAGEWRSGGVLTGGRLQIIKWDGTVVWDYLYRSAAYIPHHDIEPVYYTNDPTEKPNVLLICYTAQGDKITEIRPTGATTGEVVWEWVASQHGCAAGTGADKPEMLDLGKGGHGVEWMHANYVCFNRTLNQVVIDVKAFNEIIVVDHSTTTAQAAGRTGGRWGKGGDILYRWGNPANYGASGTRQLNGQHCGSWVLDTMPGTNLALPGAFNIMAVSNMDRKIVEFTPAGSGNGIYPRTAGQAFGPTSPLWTFAVGDMASNEGSVQRLPNGNTLICTGGVGGGMGGSGGGKIYEVTPAGATVWTLTGLSTTKAARYAFSYLDPGVTSTLSNNLKYTREHCTISSDPLSRQVRFRVGDNSGNTEFSVVNMVGEQVFRGTTSADYFIWNVGNRPAGSYIVTIKQGNRVDVKRWALMR